MMVLRRLGACALLLLVPHVAAAADETVDPSLRPPLHTAGPEDPPRAKDLLYDGNYTSILGGIALPHLAQPLPGIDRQGLGAALAGRFSVVTGFIDVGVHAEHAQWSGNSGKLARSDLGTTLSVHPAFLLIVFNSWWYDVLSGLHIYASGSVARLALDGSEAIAATGQTGSSNVDWRPGFSAGLGADIPVSPRNRHSGWWVTARYELRWTRFGAATPDWNMADSQLFVLLGYRSYDNGFARVPRPF